MFEQAFRKGTLESLEMSQDAWYLACQDLELRAPDGLTDGSAAAQVQMAPWVPGGLNGSPSVAEQARGAPEQCEAKPCLHGGCLHSLSRLNPMCSHTVVR